MGARAARRVVPGRSMEERMRIRTSAAAGAIALIALSLHAAPARAGAWTQPKDGYYFKLYGSYLATTTEFDVDGNETALFSRSENLTDGRFIDTGVSAYLEYGLFSRLTLVGTLPVKFLRSKRTEELIDGGTKKFNETTVGPADLTVGIRYAHLVRPLAVSVQGNIKVPTGYDTTPGNGAPPLGDGEVDADLRLMAGKSLYPLPFYITGSWGFRRRGGIYNDEFFYEAEFGFSTPEWLAKVALDVVQNRSNRINETTGGSGIDDPLVGEQDFTKLIIGVERALDATAKFTVDVISVIDGKNTIAGTQLAVGISYSGRE